MSPGDPFSVSGLDLGVDTIVALYRDPDEDSTIGRSNSIDQVVVQAPTITSEDDTTFTAGSSGTYTIAATGFPNAKFSVVGTLPAGVDLVTNSDDTATLEGTPTSKAGGTYTFTIYAEDGTGTPASQDFTLTVDQAPKFTGPKNATFVVGADNAITLGTVGFPTPTITDSDTLPDWLSVTDNGDGTVTISGTPDTGSEGTYSLHLTASNGIGSDATRTFPRTVATAATATASTEIDSSPTGVNEAFDVNVNVSVPDSEDIPVGSVKLYADGQYLGVGTLDGSGNTTISVASGISAGGLYDLTAVYVPGSGYATTYAPSSDVGTIEIDQAPSFVSPDTTEFDVGTSGAFLVETAGYPTATLTESGSLPSGETFTDNGDGTALITGTTTASPGIYPITITADDGIGDTTTQTLNIGVGTFVVDSSADPTDLTPGTLRAVAAANAEAAAGISSSIVFSGISEVDLTQGPIEVTAATSGAGILIAGGGSVTIDGDTANIIFTLDDQASVTLSNLVIDNGSGNPGIAAQPGSALTITGTTISELTLTDAALAIAGANDVASLTFSGTVNGSASLSTDSSASALLLDSVWAFYAGGSEFDSADLDLSSATLNVDGGSTTTSRATSPSTRSTFRAALWTFPAAGARR